MLCEVPLTKEQQDFATEHHGLVYKFLNDNHLPEDEFYDVVIFGYLRAVHRYFTESDLKQYSFGTIGWTGMKSALANYNRSLSRSKRNAEIVSVHIRPYPDSLPLEDSLAAQDSWAQQMEMQFLLHDLASRISQQQMNIVRLKRNGYGIREISSREKIPMKRIKEILEEVRIVFLEMCRE